MQRASNQSPPVPDQHLTKHSLFELHEQDIRQWAISLRQGEPLANSTMLIAAAGELNQIRCSSRTRLTCLEALRSPVHDVIDALTHRYLNQPGILSESSKAIHEACNTLNRLLAHGYSLAAAQADNNFPAFTQRKLIAVALHRALSERGQLLLRQFQTYQQPDEGFWQQIHQHYYLVLKHKRRTQGVKDAILGQCTLEQSYLRLVLLAMCNPYQLSQGDLDKLFTLLPQWVTLVELRADTAHQWTASDKSACTDTDNCTFVLNPSEDRPPTYRSLVKDPAGYLGIDTSGLVKFLDAVIDDARNPSTGPTVQPRCGDVEMSLLTHVGSALSSATERRFERIKRTGPLYIMFGFSTAHCRMADDVETDYLTAEMLDSSARGYAISLPEHNAAEIRNNEIVCFREFTNVPWSVGVTRWVRQSGNFSYRAGIEILSITPEAKIAHNIRDGTHHRAFVLPCDVLTGMPKRLLLATNAFDGGDTLELLDSRTRQSVRLTRRFDDVSGFPIFAFSPPES